MGLSSFNRMRAMREAERARQRMEEETVEIVSSKVEPQEEISKPSKKKKTDAEKLKGNKG